MSDAVLGYVIVACMIAGMGCESSPPGGAVSTASASAVVTPPGVPVLVDEKPTGAVAFPSEGETIDILETSESLPAFDQWRTLTVMATGGRTTAVTNPAKSYPGSRPILRRDEAGKLWFQLKTPKGAPGPSAVDVTEILITTTEPAGRVKAKPFVVVVDGKEQTIAWAEIDKLDKLSERRRQLGWALGKIFEHAKVKAEDDTPILITGKKDTLALTGADLRDESALVVVSTNRRGAINIALWRPKKAKDPARQVRGVKRILVGGDAAAAAQNAGVALTLDGKALKNVKLADIRGLPEVSSGSRRAGYTVVSVLGLREIDPKTVDKITVAAGDEQLEITGDALRKDANDHVLRIGRGEELQLRVGKSDTRLKGITALAITTKKR